MKYIFFILVFFTSAASAQNYIISEFKHSPALMICAPDSGCKLWTGKDYIFLSELVKKLDSVLVLYRSPIYKSGASPVIPMPMHIDTVRWLFVPFVQKDSSSKKR